MTHNINIDNSSIATVNASRPLDPFHIDGKALIWTGNGETVRIEPWGTDSVRVRASKLGIEDTEWALLPPGSSSSDGVTIDIDQEHAMLVNGGITVKATALSRFETVPGYMECRVRLAFFNAKGEQLFEEEDYGGSQRRLPRAYAWNGEGYGVTVSFEASADEHLYGMGEYQNGVLDLKGTTLELAHRNSQASVPFVVSSKGYGFLWHNPAIGEVTFAKNKTVWKAHSTRQIDYWVTVGETPAQIERHYADATGHAPAMPEWGLGFWQCKLRYWDQEEILRVAHGFKDRGIPLDLIVVDFFHWPHMGDFRLDPEFWPNPKAMVDELHEMGIKAMVSVWPHVQVDSENYEYMKQHNLLVGTKRGEDITMMFQGTTQFYDATNPEARAFVWDLCRRNYVSNGFDAFWLDEAEPEYATYDFDNYVYWTGTNERTGNIYPQRYNQGFYEGQLAEGREGEIVNLTRCAWAGSQRYGSLVWSGDVGSTFADLRAQITCAINLGMAGIPWFTTDMGGFHDGVIESPAFHELLVRWAQFSCFSPVMRNHGDRSTTATPDGKVHVFGADGVERAPAGADNEPWSFGADVERILVKYIKVREALRPYARELFAAAHEDGQPLMRGLFYEFPGDPNAADVPDEYMFGPDLLVAPVVEAGVDEREVYLPGDANVTWTELHTGRSYVGGTTVKAVAPLDVLPVFARNGATHGLDDLI